MFKNFCITSKTVNFVASSALPVYLLHDEDTFMRGELIDICHWIYSCSSIWYLPLIVFIVAPIIFIVAVGFDKMLNYALFFPIGKLISKMDLFKYISLKINNKTHEKDF